MDLKEVSRIANGLKFAEGYHKAQYSSEKPIGSHWFKMSCLTCLVFSCVCFLKRWNYRDKETEINFRNDKWIIGCSYIPHNADISSHMNCMGKAIDSLSSRYENVLLIGDLNVEVSEMSMKDFCDIYSFKNLIKERTCFKNPTNPKCIDLLLSNRHRSFQNLCVI